MTCKQTLALSHTFLMNNATDSRLFFFGLAFSHIVEVIKFCVSFTLHVHPGTTLPFYPGSGLTLSGWGNEGNVGFGVLPRDTLVMWLEIDLATFHLGAIPEHGSKTDHKSHIVTRVPGLNI